MSINERKRALQYQESVRPRELVCYIKGRGLSGLNDVRRESEWLWIDYECRYKHHGF